VADTKFSDFSAASAAAPVDAVGLQSGSNVKFAAPVGHDAQTAVAGAATSAVNNVVVTSEALTAATTYTLTLTDALATTTSIIQVTAYDGTSAWTVTNITRNAGSVVIALKTTLALTGAVKIHVSILN
jgi:hypothetical protein